MPVIQVRKDPSALTLTLTAELSAPLERAWQLLADPRKLERWWGPPSYPATVEEHDLTPGGRVSYYMTGPEGDQPRGWWRVLTVDPPWSLEVEDGFADAEGAPDPNMPSTTMRFSLEEAAPGKTLMTTVTTFPSLEAMERLVAMGMEEGIRLAAGQMDEVLEEAA
ncbi:MAG TPA: SRPBCC domain-containing protein [Gemmatimonadota bacterium]|nr:SRPBCC domain-containing protein [Gemmatimonadota bacterium]